MRVLFLTQYFPPEMGAPQARLSELGERLIDRGWDVEALTALPNYPTGHVFEGYRPWKSCVEDVGRIRSIRVPIYPSTAGFVKRLANYFSFVATSALLGKRRCTPPDVLLVESPPIFIGYAARYLSWRWGCPYVLNVSDLWLDAAIRMGAVKEGFATRRVARLEQKLYDQAAGITGQAQEIIDAVNAKAPHVPTALITNGVDPERFGPTNLDDEARELLGHEPGPIFIFAGLLGLAQGLDQLLDLAKELDDNEPGRIVLIGDGPVRDHLATRIAQESLNRVRLLPPQPRHRVPSLLAAADVALISLSMSIPGSVPSKIYEAMAASLPILMVAEGEASRRVDDADCGICVRPGEMDAALEAFRRLAGDPALRKQLGASGRKAAETNYNRDHIAARLDQFLRTLTTDQETHSTPARAHQPDA